MNMAEIKALGAEDGANMVRDGSSDPGPEGWDGLLLSAIGCAAVWELFGLPSDSDQEGYTPAQVQALAWYVEGATEGALAVAREEIRN